MASKLATFIKFHAAQFGHVRFKEPIVVLESDDWGKVNANASANFKPEYGKRALWSYDQLETAEECEVLFNTLKQFKDDFEQPPVFTANVIVSNPDVEATQKNGFQELVLKPVDQAFPELVDVWKKGMHQRVFYPQYHGRLHYNYNEYLNYIATNPVAQALFLQGVNGGLQHFERTKQAYFSEYQSFTSPPQDQNMQHWVKTGLNQFERIFNVKSQSIIAPNYVLHPKDISAFINTGVKYIQGCNKLVYKQSGVLKYASYCQGKSLKHGFTALARNHKFEPNRKDKRWDAESAITASNFWFKRHVPVVLDTHRFNYIGQYAKHGINQLNQLLASYRNVKGLRFLTSNELGEAITNKGMYRSVFTGQVIKLTPLDSIWRKSARMLVK